MFYKQKITDLINFIEDADKIKLSTLDGNNKLSKEKVLTKEQLNYLKLMIIDKKQEFIYNPLEQLVNSF